MQIALYHNLKKLLLKLSFMIIIIIVIIIITIIIIIISSSSSSSSSCTIKDRKQRLQMLTLSPVWPGDP